MVVSVWFTMWFSINPLKQFHLVVALIPISECVHLMPFYLFYIFFTKWQRVSIFFLLFCLKFCNWHIPLTYHFYLMLVPQELSPSNVNFLHICKDTKPKKHYMKNYDFQVELLGFQNLENLKLHSQWWGDMPPHGYTRVTKNDSDAPS